MDFVIPAIWEYSFEYDPPTHQLKLPDESSAGIDADTYQ